MSLVLLGEESWAHLESASCSLGSVRASSAGRVLAGAHRVCQASWTWGVGQGRTPRPCPSEEVLWLQALPPSCPMHILSVSHICHAALKAGFRLSSMSHLVKGWRGDKKAALLEGLSVLLCVFPVSIMDLAEPITLVEVSPSALAAP